MTNRLRAKIQEQRDFIKEHREEVHEIVVPND